MESVVEASLFITILHCGGCVSVVLPIIICAPPPPPPPPPQDENGITQIIINKPYSIFEK
jgi:hypothetical protein